MAGASTPFGGGGGACKLYQSYLKRTNVLSVAFVAFLCSASYFLGVWQHAGAGPGGAAVVLTAVPCDRRAAGAGAAPATATALDFAAHHSAAAEEEGLAVEEGRRGRRGFPACDAKFAEYTPCEDRDRSLRFERERLVYRERHCPEKGEALKCLVPAPSGYRNPFPWPASRGVAWFANVPHKELTVEKAVQNWIRVDGDKFRFPGGGTMFPNGADAYIDDMQRLAPALRSGAVRTALDTGCGVQFALERGVPAMIGVLASNRLPYPARAFDMAHCSRCLIPWHLYDGQYLIEIDRVLRPGGFWILSGPPINWKRHWKGWQRTQEDLSAEQNAIESVAKSLCWNKIKEQEDIAIWQKPVNHVHCKASRKLVQSPPFCPAQDPDAAWYNKMETCITALPEVASIEQVAGGELKNWPERLTAVPPRISSGSLEGVTAEMFLQDTALWKKRVGYYKTVINQLGQKGRYRNLLDMNARFGGFAAALIDDPVWVMNMVPTATNIHTLGVIYERGLIGTYQDWCEAMSTYPRTYDLIHADSVFTLYKDRCEMEDILLEMDRILRPEGTVIFRDDVDILVKIKSIADGMRWDSQIVDHEDGPLKREKLLLVVKTYWTAQDQNHEQ
ncbi:putative methyltransferase PMT15 [Ananas comosus]|uniref:Methyltransferase n=1 Tax=Ananas comosus TaxID=4615 RepID=A0A199UI06_ANACO|nr:putative methyltransferase PMT15 [Ananas comosus]